MGLKAKATNLIGGLVRSWFPGSGLSVMFGGAGSGYTGGLSIGGMQSAAGAIVTEVTALQLVTFFACLRNISETIGGMPFEVSEVKNGRRTPRTDCAMYQLLHESPNPEMSPIDFVSALLFGAVGWGNGYAEIERARNGRPLALWPIESWKMTPMRRQNGDLYYIYNGDTGARELEPRDVFHIKNISTDGVNGLPPTRLAKNALGLSIVLQEYGSKWFASGGSYKVLIHPPTGATKEQMQTIVTTYKSGDTAGVGVLPPGWTSQVVSCSPEDGQALESEHKADLRICRLFRMPPSKIQDNTNSTYNNVEMENRAYLTDCLLSWATKIEQECSRKLRVGGEDTVSGAFNFDSLLRADPLTKARADQINFLMGAKSPNEIRASNGLNPYDGGDKFVIPANMTSMDALETMRRSDLEIQLAGMGVKLKTLPPSSSPPADPAADPSAEITDPPGGVIPGQPDDNPDPIMERAINGIKHAHAAQLHDVLMRLLHTETDKALRASRKDGFEKWVEDFYTNHAEHVRSAMKPVIQRLDQSLRTLTGSSAQTDVDSVVETLVKNHVAASRGDMELAGLEQRLSYWKDGTRAQAFVEQEMDTVIQALTSKDSK